MEHRSSFFAGKLELNLTRVGFGFLLSIILLLGVSSYSHMNFKTAHHGNEYTMLSEEPFNFEADNDLQLRILSPLMGYLFFMRGPLFKYFMLFVLAVFFTVVYVYLRRKKLSVIEATLTVAMLAFTTLGFHQLYFPAYTDPGSYLLIILLMIAYTNLTATTLLLTCLLFNHESNIFLFPFFFLLIVRGANTKIFFRTITQFAVAIFTYYLYREFISSRVQMNFTLDYYLDPANIQWTREHVVPNLLIGVFQSFRLLWIIPLAAICIDLYEKRFYEILLILSAVVFVMFQFLIAYDISRLSGLAFPAILLGAIRLKEFLGDKKFIWSVSTLLILNFLIPSYYVGALEPFKYGPGWLSSFF